MNKISMDIAEKNTSPLLGEAQRLREMYPENDDLVLAIRRHLEDHAGSLPSVYKPKSVLESRFMSPDEAYERGALSCGTMVNMATKMLRALGLKVKLIHGESADSVHHAWFAIFDEASQSWKEYDITEEDCKVPATNVKKAECESWEEISLGLEEAHRTYREDMAKRGLE